MSGSEQKVLPPSAKKLRDARRRGEVARSKELVTAAVTTAGFLTLLLAGPSTMGKFADAALAAAPLETEGLSAALEVLAPRLAWIALGLLGPLLLLVVATAVLTSIVANGGLTFAADPITPKLQRLDPIKGLGRFFNVRSLIELLKSFAKLIVVLAVCVTVLRGEVPSLAQLPACGMACLPGVLHDALVPLLISCCLVFLLLGILDVGLQRWLFRRDMRMTLTEHKRDRKDSHGDPQLLARRRRERREIAQLAPRTGLKHATFVVQSADAALAFRYARPDATVPILVARGRTDTSQQLVAEARRKGLPIVFDPEAVAAVARIEIGRNIPRAAFAPIIQCMRAAGLIG